MTPNFIPFALPDIGEEEINEVIDTLRSGWLTTGPKTRLFEQQFAEFIGVKHALAVNSGTAALHLGLEAVGIQAGDKVATTPYTFTATAEVIRYLGADPVFVDIDPRTFNIDVNQLANVLASTDRIKAIIPVHIAGQSCDMDGILKLAKEYDIKVIEDAAHALPTYYKEKLIGTLGDVTAYSFYATKPLATGEGGMLVTPHDDYAERFKIMRLHGINRDVFKRESTPQPSWYYEVVAPGFKYNMSDIMAALGIQQLHKVEQSLHRRATIAARYDASFSDLPLQRPYRDENSSHAWHLYIIQLNLAELTLNRDQFIEALKQRGIGASVHFIPLHIQPYWRDRYGFQPHDFPYALETYQRSLSLPIYPTLSEQDVSYIISTVQDICHEAAR
ncbi:DegT/DnrJ/EryC1/StrS family aminotransferase [Thioflexithrix psekupsensis]|uniref:UDP-4-amino-4, 6-dideoxy-N-acetyl-beta-L-altrosamine transaminase n=1 Tax=Thioflexithrix psekupsensis TaxID=1570016 RepID=A0A251X317_9GAMM|nr:DegT/DnrJ/EryC1/StrS aminotransferase family protein [Thioflexithrix psekupsensis]OUD11666.1 UDP-4-amino-4,6-dideoxy-N-acetyl-beta-L-altrosamine transaminase [Thioflexithrix psekupsensis]